MVKSFLSSSLIIGGILIANAFRIVASPNYPYRFCRALPIPDVLVPALTYEPPNGGPSIDYYEIKISPFSKSLWPTPLECGVPDPGDPAIEATRMVGYNGMYPGPTLKVKRNQETVVRFINEGSHNASIHLHGSATVAPFDGWAMDMIKPNQYKDYYYPNFQPGRTLWYHDHAHLLTAENVREGQAGLYILEDEAEESKYNFPNGTYDIPLVLSSKTYNNSGQIIGGAPDTVEVNGELWPHLVVEPRKYRFRILNGAATRTFQLQLRDNSNDAVQFTVIASDSGFLSEPANVRELKISMGERYEIVVDMAPFQTGGLLTLINAAIPETPPVDPLREIMQFRVEQDLTDDSNNGPIPTKLRELHALPQPSSSAKEFVFGRTGNFWTINNVTFSDPIHRVLHNVPRGTIETWTLRNDGGAVHPVHIHLIDFQIISRTSAGGIADYEKYGFKDIVILNPQETVEVLAKYYPWDGLYMFHCHNLDHEDAEMMAAFNVTALSDFGYTEKTRLLDPEDPNWAAQDYNPDDWSNERILNVTLPQFYNLQLYSNISGLSEALDKYHGYNSTRKFKRNRRWQW